MGKRLAVVIAVVGVVVGLSVMPGCISVSEAGSGAETAGAGQADSACVLDVVGGRFAEGIECIERTVSQCLTDIEYVCIGRRVPSFS